MRAVARASGGFPDVCEGGARLSGAQFSARHRPMPHPRVLRPYPTDDRCCRRGGQPATRCPTGARAQRPAIAAALADFQAAVLVIRIHPGHVVRHLFVEVFNVVWARAYRPSAQTLPSAKLCCDEGAGRPRSSAPILCGAACLFPRTPVTLLPKQGALYGPRSLTRASFALTSPRR
jgi:hypothetical protein